MQRFIVLCTSLTFLIPGVLFKTPLGIFSLAELLLVIQLPLSLGVFFTRSIIRLNHWHLVTFYLLAIGVMHTFEVNDITNHLINLLRAIGAMLWSLCLIRFGNEAQVSLRSVFSFLFFFHAFFFFLDFLGYLPLNWSAGFTLIEKDTFYRPSGLFGEPSFLVFYLAVLLLIERQVYGKIFNIKYIIFIIVSLTSVSLLGFVLLLMFLIPTIKKSRVVLLFSFLLILFFGSAVYTRITEYRSDGSAIKRVFGNYLLAKHIVETSPILGVGMGGSNLNLFIQETEVPSTLNFILSKSDLDCIRNNTCSSPLKAASTSFVTASLYQGGIVLLVLITLLYYSCFNRKYLFGLFIIMSSMKGQLFEPYILYSLALLYVKKHDNFRFSL